jgi:hypothetical protein
VNAARWSATQECPQECLRHDHPRACFEAILSFRLGGAFQFQEAKRRLERRRGIRWCAHSGLMRAGENAFT